VTDLIELRGKTALVTGAAKRLGRAVALALGRAGVNVAVHYQRSAEEAQSLAQELAALGVCSWLLPHDLSDSAAAGELFGGAVDLAGPIDFLVNSASIFPAQSLTDFERADLFRCVEVNALSPLELAKAFAAQRRAGAIVNFLDTMIADYDRAHVPYHLSKQMLFSLTRMMAFEFAPLVRVNAVAPGLVLPPAGEDTGFLERLAHTNPLQRYGSEEGVCEAVLFLLRSGFVTGQVVYVDGGRHLRGKMYG
jgi:hypothetical protein